MDWEKEWRASEARTRAVWDHVREIKQLHAEKLAAVEEDVLRRIAAAEGLAVEQNLKRAAIQERAKKALTLLNSVNPPSDTFGQTYQYIRQQVADLLKEDS